MSFTLSTGLMASNYAGNTKKSTASGIIFAGWAAGLIAGPREHGASIISARYPLTNTLEFFLASQAPVYDLAFRMLSMSHTPGIFFSIKLFTDNDIVDSGLLCSDDYCTDFTIHVVSV